MYYIIDEMPLMGNVVGLNPTSYMNILSNEDMIKSQMKQFVLKESDQK